VLPEASIGVGEFSTPVSLKGGGFLGYQNDAYLPERELLVKLAYRTGIPPLKN